MKKQMLLNVKGLCGRHPAQNKHIHFIFVKSIPFSLKYTALDAYRNIADFPLKKLQYALYRCAPPVRLGCPGI